MKIKRLYIGSMGTYRNALLENLSSKIIVIGGRNRAGKTTFLETMRHMVYGFPKGLRESALEYEVEGDLIDEKGKEYYLTVRGQKEPVLLDSQSGGSVSFKELLGNMDRYTYSQLYTITLDELKKSNVKAEEEKLQAVLLGAGLKEIVHIPKIVEEFKKDKERIGGKLGNPNTKLFKPHYDKITEGVEQRELAVGQLEDYRVRTEELQETESKIEELSKEMESLQKKLTVFEALKSCHSIIADKKLLELELEQYSIPLESQFEDYPALEKVKTLQEEYENLLNHYKELKEGFEKQVSKDRQVYELMLINKNKLREEWRNSSGLKQGISNWMAAQKQYNNNKDEIIKRMNTINSSLQGDLLKVLELECDSLEQDKLQDMVERIRLLEEQKRTVEWEQKDIEGQREAMNKEFAGAKAEPAGMFLKNYLYTSLGISFVGAILLFVNKTLGAGVIFVGATAALLYFYTRYSAQTSSQGRYKDLQSQIRIIENRTEGCKLRLKTVNEELEQLMSQLHYFKEKMKLEKEITPLGVLNYCKEIQQLKKDIMSIGSLGRRNSNEYETIKKSLINLKELLRLINNKEYEEVEFLKLSDKLFYDLEITAEQLSDAEKLQEAEARLYEYEDKLRRLLKIEVKETEILYEIESIVKKYEVYHSYRSLSERISASNRQIEHILSTERVANAFISFCSSQGIEGSNAIKCIDELFNMYPLKEQVERVYLDTKTEMQECTDTHEKFKERRQWIKSELEKLSTTEKLEKAQRLIDEGRAGLQGLARKFSTLSAAEFILEAVQRNFIDTAKDTLLSGAADILSRITDGEYKAILPSENLLEANYKTVLKNGKVNSSDSVLSRGTGEQLYLSVRLNRIKSMEPKLPVVLDDPFVNFDSQHTKNTLELFCELGESNQTFLLTCHPELIEMLMKIKKDIQYWKLDEGNFSLINGEELHKYLSCK